MQFELEKAIAVLERTPAALRALLDGLPAEWTASNEGENTWSPFDVLGHLVHGEKTDWIPRARIILESGESRPFESFDRFAQFRESEGKTLGELLDEFARLRAENLEALAGMRLEAADFDRTGTHPELGRVTLGELLATWVAHDLDHVVQVSRTMAKQYRDEVGPWRAFLSVLRS
jgi:hypothetical protein